MILAILILISAFLLNLFLPWWSIAIPGLILGYAYDKKALSSFGWGFLGVFILWGIQSAWIDWANSGLLSSRIAEMLQAGSGWVLILLTALLGGLVSGLAAATGSLFRQIK